MSVSDAGSISGATTKPGITGPDPSPTIRGPTADHPGAGAGSRDAAPGSKRKAGDEWAAKLHDPRAPPVAAKMQSTLHDHMWWKNSRAEEYQHMAGTEPTTELRRRTAPTIEDTAVQIPSPKLNTLGAAESEEALRKAKTSSADAGSRSGSHSSPPFPGHWTDLQNRMSSAAKRLKHTAAEALPHGTASPDTTPGRAAVSAGDMKSPRSLAPASAEVEAESEPPMQQTNVAAGDVMDWSPAVASVPVLTPGTGAGAGAPQPLMRSPRLGADTTAGRSPLQKLREMLTRKPGAPPSPSLGPARPGSSAPAVNSPRAGMAKPAVSHTAPVMDIGTPLPPPLKPDAALYRGAPTMPDTKPSQSLFAKLKGFFRRSKPEAADDRASDK